MTPAVPYMNEDMPRLVRIDVSETGSGPLAISSPTCRNHFSPAQPSSRVGQLSLPMRQLLPLRPVCCSKISLPTTTMTETFHRSATSFHTRAPPCLSVASQHGSGRSGLTPSLPQAHLETGQYKNSLCLEAAQYNSPVSMDLLRLKRSGGKKKWKNDRAPHGMPGC